MSKILLAAMRRRCIVADLHRWLRRVLHGSQMLCIIRVSTKSTKNLERALQRLKGKRYPKGTEVAISQED